MSTDIRADISKSNPFHIDKHRYYELKHFCLQYPMWKQRLANLSYLTSKPVIYETPKGDIYSDRTADLVELRDLYLTRTEIIEIAADCTDKLLGDYILEAVTNGLSYEKLNARRKIPCNKTTYYELYRKFFFVLNDLRS